MSGKRLPELIRRQRALAHVMAKYRGKPCDFATADCVRMARTMLVKMGHRGLPKLPRYSTLIGAKRALTKAGFADVHAMLDAVLPERRIAPAAMLPGDLMVVPGEDGLGAIWVNVGNARALGWHQDAEEAVIVAPSHIEAAWRV